MVVVLKWILHFGIINMNFETEGGLGLGDIVQRITPTRVSIASVLSFQALYRGGIAVGMLQISILFSKLLIFLFLFGDQFLAAPCSLGDQTPSGSFLKLFTFYIF